MALDLQMNGEAAGEGRFSGGRGAGHENDMLILRGDFLCNIAEGAFMEGLIDTDEIPELMMINHGSNIRDVPDAEDITPAGALREDVQMLRPVKIGRGVEMILRGGELQHEAAPELKEREDRNRSGGGGHGTVEILPHAVDSVHREGRERTALQKLDLIGLLFLSEIINGIVPGPALFFKGEIQGNEASHLVFYLYNLLAMENTARHPDKDSVTDGILDAHLLIGEEMAKGQEQDETEGTLVNTAAFLVIESQREKGAVFRDRITQLDSDTALQGSQSANGEGIKGFETLADGGTFREGGFFLAAADFHRVRTSFCN